MLITLRSGARVDSTAPDLSDVTLEDIAWALGRTPRFGGHCDPPLSYAQHTLACARHAAKESPLLGLMALHGEDGVAFTGPPPAVVMALAPWRSAKHRATLRCIERFAPACVDLSWAVARVYTARAEVTELRERLHAVPGAEDPRPLPRKHYYASDTWQTWMGLHHKLVERAERWLAAEADDD